MAEKRRAARAGGGGGEGEGTRGARARARSGIEPRGSRRDAPEVGGDVKLRAVWSASRRWRAARTADEDEARMTGGAPDGPGGREAQSVRSDQAAREPIKYPSETDGSRTAKCPVINSGRNRTSVTRRFVSSGISGLMRSSARRPNPNDERARRFYVRVVSGAPSPPSPSRSPAPSTRARAHSHPPPTPPAPLESPTRFSLTTAGRRTRRWRPSPNRPASTSPGTRSRWRSRPPPSRRAGPRSCGSTRSGSSYRSRARSRRASGS